MQEAAPRLPQWRDYLATITDADQLLGLLPDAADPDACQSVYRLMFSALASGYFSAFSDPDAPDFVPLVNTALNSVGTNPDFIYGYTRIDGAGHYRLSGHRGDGLFLLFDLAAGGLGVMDEPGPSVGQLDVDTLTLSSDGSFDVMLSATRPAGHSGDWFALDPSATTIAARQASYDWGTGREARLAIERLDAPSPHRGPDVAAVAERLQRLADFPRRFGQFALAYGKRQREQGLVNRLEHDDWSGRGGVAGQHYYQGMFRLEPGEALILETALPQRVRYWNVQLNDPLWNTIDWVNHQSSLNGGQATIDEDGRFRAVVSVGDPGVPNWLDPAGLREGSLMLRWTEANSGPEPSLRIVPFADLGRHLPESTRRVTASERDAVARHRRRGAQLRRRW